jgi:gamma-glutamylcyclotransferase
LTAPAATRYTSVLEGRMFRYFAYGSALSVARTREWCDSHGMDIGPFLAGVPARLDDWKLEFRVPSRYWQGLVADLVPAPGHAVHGVLFELADDAREAVLHKEGVATGLFREVSVEITAGDRKLTASSFAAEPSRIAAAGPPSTSYLDALITGAQERNLPPEWVATLRASKI